MATIKGVMNEEGTEIVVWGMGNAMESWIWLDEEKIQAKKDDRDDYDAPR